MLDVNLTHVTLTVRYMLAWLSSLLLELAVDELRKVEYGMMVRMQNH